MKTATVTLIWIVFLSILTACSSTPKVSSDYDTSFNFAALKTYQWAPNSGGDEQFQSLYGQRVEAAIETQLGNKGHTKASANPDFLITYHVSIDKKVDVDTYYDNWGVGYRPYWGYGYQGPTRATTHVREYNEGTLVIDVIDPKGKQVVWRGSSSGTVKKNKTPEERTARIQEVVTAMMAAFPPIN